MVMQKRNVFIYIFLLAKDIYLLLSNIIAEKICERSLVFLIKADIS